MSDDMGFATNYLPLSGLRSGNNENGTANVIEVSADKNATSIASTWINDAATNRSQHFRDLMRKDFVFDRTDVRVIFISLYSLVFCCCFCGNFMVILVVVMSRRLRSITNFFLANLAVADFCVGVFCVLQNLSIYLIDSWVFGEFLCKMYQFVHALSYTASIFILMVICVERYFAIIYPITCKQILTPTRLRLVIIGVWLASAVYSTPKFIFSRTITNVYSNGKSEEICIMHRKLFNSKILDIVNFGALYILPLLVMSILYSRIAVVLWKSFRGFKRKNDAVHNLIAVAPNGKCKSTKKSLNELNLLGERSVKKDENRSTMVNINPVQFDNESNAMLCKIQSLAEMTPTTTGSAVRTNYHQRHTNNKLYEISSNNVLLARRGVIRMLVIVVLTFAGCNLPLHARKMWQYWSNSYDGASNFNALLTPLTFLVSYFNSAINPLLYAFLSKNFRKGMRELLCCSHKKTRNGEQFRRKITIQNYSLPTDSTNVGYMQ